MSTTPVIHAVSWVDNLPVFDCSGSTESWCHVFPDCDCETFPTGHDDQPGHEPAMHDECLYVSFLKTSSDDAVAAYDDDAFEPNPVVPQHDGEIKVWIGDYGDIRWSYDVDDLSDLQEAV